MTCGNITFSFIDYYNNRLKSLRESVIKFTNDPNAMHDGFRIYIGIHCTSPVTVKRPI